MAGGPGAVESVPRLVPPELPTDGADLPCAGRSHDARLAPPPDLELLAQPSGQLVRGRVQQPLGILQRSLVNSLNSLDCVGGPERLGGHGRRRVEGMADLRRNPGLYVGDAPLDGSVLAGGQAHDGGAGGLDRRSAVLAETKIDAEVAVVSDQGLVISVDVVCGGRGQQADAGQFPAAPVAGVAHGTPTPLQKAACERLLPTVRPFLQITPRFQHFLTEKKAADLCPNRAILMGYSTIFF